VGASDISGVPAATLRQYLRPIGKTADFTVPAPPLPATSTSISARRVWSFAHSASQLTKITNVTCRSRETGYKTHKVLNELRFGLDTGTNGTMQDRISIEPAFSTSRIDLPLESRFLHSKWIVTGGWMPNGAHRLWPLEMYLDYGMVLAFTYQLAGGDVLPYVPRTDDAGEAALEEMLAGDPSDAASDRWVSRARSGDFMPTSGATGSHTSGRVGETVEVAASLRRVLVVLSFAVFRERNDFEPGGIVGMFKLSPNIMVRTTEELQRVKTSIKIDRPPRTTQLDSGDGTVAASCCGSYADISSLLVADSNENPYGPNDGFKPFWSGIFSAYEIDPDSRLGGQRLKMVDTSKSSRRTVTGCGTRDLVGSPETLSDIEKMPRQGEFDNIHLAPRLRLDACELEVLTPGLIGGPSHRRVPINAARMKLDPVVMAPFCSHDCFHMHWRWSSQDTSAWVLGWGSAGPNTEPGVPMVAPNQDVEVVFHSPHTITYHTEAKQRAIHTSRSTSIANIAPLDWTISMHHGAAYASGIVDWRDRTGEWLLAQLGNIRSGVSSLWEQYLFVDASGRYINLRDKPALLYWLLRYHPEETSTGFEARPWLDISTADVDRARRG
jgi:hypothetical protein